MRRKRYIAFVLCALYLAATAGMALASMTCQCVGMKRHVVEKTCSACCQHGLSVGHVDCDECLLGAGCSCELHSTEIDLYVASHSDDSEKYVRCVVAELPPSMAAECPCPAHLPALRAGVVLPPEPPVREIPAQVDGLRAPPVRV